ncbi:MAG: ribonuclease D, partial [Acidobacteriota bacterium]
MNPRSKIVPPTDWNAGGPPATPRVSRRRPIKVSSGGFFVLRTHAGGSPAFQSVFRYNSYHRTFMEIYFQLITDAEGVRNACRDVAGEKFLGFDTETTELDPYRGDLRLVQFSTGKATYVIDLKPFRSGGPLVSNPDLAPLRDLLSDAGKIKIAHNAKFDAKWVRHHLGAELNGIFDTFLSSQLIAAGDSERRHSLADVAQFFTGTELDKSEQISDWSGELSQSQLEYAARDAAVMIPLREQIEDRLKNDDLRQAAGLEFECVMPIAQMELNGFYLDEARWREQV